MDSNFGSSGFFGDSGGSIPCNGDPKSDKDVVDDCDWSNVGGVVNNFGVSF